MAKGATNGFSVLWRTGIERMVAEIYQGHHTCPFYCDILAGAFFQILMGLVVHMVCAEYRKDGRLKDAGRLYLVYNFGRRTSGACFRPISHALDATASVSLDGLCYRMYNTKISMPIP